MTKDTFLSNYTEIRPVVSVSKFVCVCVCVCVGGGGGGGYGFACFLINHDEQSW